MSMMPEDTEVIANKHLPEVFTCKVYRIRWAILIIFVISCASSIMQWVQFSIIADVVVKYYGVSYEAVDWTSMVYLLMYIPLVFPGTYIMDKLGLRIAMLLGMTGTCIGSWLKVASVAPDRFWVALLGQTIVAASQMYMMSAPAALAAIWFGANEVSSACSIGVFGIQFGIALSFLIPPMLVNGEGDKAAIERDLYTMLISVAVVNSILLIILFLFFKAEPPAAPSEARLQSQAKEAASSFLQPLKRLVSNRAYMLLLAAYGINIGVFYALSALLNQIILTYYPDASEDAGRIGLILVVAGMVGSVSCGVILDKFNRFKGTLIVVYTFCVVGMICFSFTLHQGIAVVYVVSVILGFFMTGLLPVGFEIAAELTYPEPEGTSAGLLTAAASALGILFTYLYSYLFYNVSDLCANLVMCALLLVGLILILFIRFEFRRQAAQSKIGVTNYGFS